MIVTPPPCRIPSDPYFRYRSDLSQSVDKTLVLISVAIIDMSSVVHLRSSQSFLPNRVMLRLFPWRSPHTLFTYAAQGGLGSPPDRRTRGACPHHKYSMVELHPEDLPSGHTVNFVDSYRLGPGLPVMDMKKHAGGAACLPVRHPKSGAGAG